MSLSAWFERRRRKLMTRWRARVSPLPASSRPIICLFCDFEGHHAGDHAGRSADAGTDILLSLLQRRGLQITFNIVAELCRTHPDRIRRIALAGHDIACHGWRHERPRDLDAAEQDRVLEKALAAFASLGLRPSGFRSPESDWSWRLVQRLPAFGFHWNAERDPALGPYRITRRLVRLPVRTDDWDLTEQGSAVESLISKWEAEASRLNEKGGVLCLGLHEWVLGARPELAVQLERAIEKWKQAGRFDFTTLTSAAGGPQPSRIAVTAGGSSSQ